MLYLVQVDAAMQRANRIDAGEGPGPTFAKITDRFRPEAIYGNPTRREVLMVVNLDTPAAIAELMYALTWFTGSHPTFTPLTKLDTFGEAIEAAKRIVTPPT
jgi:hypothetical protein